MTKRLRKKLRLREFQEMGFETAFDLNIPNEDEEELFAFWDRMIDFIEANNLNIGGGMTEFFVCAGSRRTATEADRAAIEVWLQQQPEVSNVAVGSLIDAWHGKFE